MTFLKSEFFQLFRLHAIHFKGLSLFKFLPYSLLSVKVRFQRLEIDISAYGHEIVEALAKKLVDP